MNGNKEKECSEVKSEKINFKLTTIVVDASIKAHNSSTYFVHVKC